jgi:tetratricopeptide (TPR) repeat protein
VFNRVGNSHFSLCKEELTDGEEVRGVIGALRYGRFGKDTEAAFAAIQAGRYAEGEAQLVALLERAERQFWPDSSFTGNALRNVAELQLAQGNYVAAEPMLRRALRNFERDEPRSFLIVVLLMDLAKIYKARGQYELPGPLLERAASQAERSEGMAPDHPLAVDCLEELGVWYQEVDRSAEALAVLARVLHMRERALGHDHPRAAADPAGTRGRFAIVSCATDRYPGSGDDRGTSCGSPDSPLWPL